MKGDWDIFSSSFNLTWNYLVIKKAYIICKKLFIKLIEKERKKPPFNQNFFHYSSYTVYTSLYTNSFFHFPRGPLVKQDDVRVFQFQEPPGILFQLSSGCHNVVPSYTSAIVNSTVVKIPLTHHYPKIWGGTPKSSLPTPNQEY